MVMPKDPVNKPRTAGPKTNMGPENIPTKPKGIMPVVGPTKPKGIKPVKPVKPVRGGSRPAPKPPKPGDLFKPVLYKVPGMMAKGGMAKKGKK